MRWYVFAHSRYFFSYVQFLAPIHPKYHGSIQTKDGLERKIPIQKLFDHNDPRRLFRSCVCLLFQAAAAA